MTDLCYDKTDEEEKRLRRCDTCAHLDKFESGESWDKYTYRRCTYYPSPCYDQTVSPANNCQWFHKQQAGKRREP